MKRFFYIFVLFTFILPPLSIKAQNNNPTPFCGISQADQNFIFQKMLENRTRYSDYVQLRAVAYVPVALHLVATANGLARVSEAKVMDYLAALNKTYSTNATDLQFYIKYITYIDRDEIYSTPAAFSGYSRMASLKKTDALNIFFCGELGDGVITNSTLLGYYINTYSTPYAADWLAIRNAEVTKGANSTIEHELGHFFTLPHTHKGWDDAPFKPTAAAPCAPKLVSTNGGATFTVENVARTGPDANCATAGDGFCDTPADYNFGFGWTDCNYTGIAKDPTCVAVDPDETNIMSYFSSKCVNKFSTEQKAAMQKDYASSARAYLRTGSITPSQTDMTAPTLQVPAYNARLASFTSIDFDWTDVAGVTANDPNKASGYIIEISTFATFAANVITLQAPTSNITLNAANTVAIPGFLANNTKYYWRVRPYGPYKTAFTNQAPFIFGTGNVNAVQEISGVDNFTVSPNPVAANQTLEINLTSIKPFEGLVKMSSTTGQIVKSEKTNFIAGANSKTLKINDLSKGIYILSIESEQGVLNKKVVISE